MIVKLNIFVRSCGLFLLIAMSTQFMQAEDYFPTMYSVVKTYNGRYLVHDTAYNRTLELSQTSLFSGGNSQLKITTSATSISGKVISLPVMANEVASINKSRLLLLYSGFNSGILLIDTNGNTIDSDTSLSARGDSLKLMGTFGNSLLIKAGNSVFAIESISDSIKSTLVQENVFAIDHTQKGIVCIVKKAGGLSLRTIDTSGKVLLDFPFTPMGSSYRVIASKQAILVLSTSTGYSTTGFLFTLRDNKQKMLFFPCSPSLCTMWEVDDQQLLAWIAEGSDGTYSLSIQQSDGNINKLTFPLFCSNPFSIIYQDNQLYILFSNSLAICDSKSSPAFTTVSSIAQLRNIISDYASVSEINGRTIISDNNHNIFLQSTHDSLWWIRGFADNVGKYIATLAIVGFLFIFYRRYSRQNKFLEAGLELSGMGLIIYLDAEGRVKKLNTLAKTILGISSDVPLNRPIRYYCLKPSLNELLSFIETTLEFRQPAQSRISIGEHEYAKEYIWSSTPLFGFAGNYAGCILSG